MMTSEGSGMQADSMAISSTMPAYPPAEMTEMIKTLSAARILEIIGEVGRSEETQKSCDSWVKVYPGSVAPSSDFCTFTRTDSALAASAEASRSMAYCASTSL